MVNSGIGSIPKHRYVYVDSSFTHHNAVGFVPAVWFGLVSFPSRVWGLNVMLESGAVYRSLPPHAISFIPDPPEWRCDQSQMWDCYGQDWAAHEYTYLRGLEAKCRIRGENFRGTYLFTVAPLNDGFSEAPEQSKEFKFIALDNGRLTILPTNRVMFRDISFTDDSAEVPRLKLQTDTYHCETQCLPSVNPVPAQRKPSQFPIPNPQSPVEIQRGKTWLERLTDFFTLRNAKTRH